MDEQIIRKTFQPDLAYLFNTLFNNLIVGGFKAIIQCSFDITALPRFRTENIVVKVILNHNGGINL
jgi:hypothetical protein